MKIIVNVLRAEPTKVLAANEPTVERIGTILATDHILAFEISSVLLLGALIGAAIISRPRRERQD
jgi:NADH-quinone oxidoreductase subunit J